jgi:hypothetical protein
MNSVNAEQNPLTDKMKSFHRTLTRLVPWWALFCFLGWCWIYVSPEHSMDDADPEILDQAWRVVKGEAIYTPGLEAPPYMHAEYTPIFYYLGAAGLRLTGLSFIPTEFISFLGSLALFSAFVYFGQTRLGSWKRGGWAGCLFFLVPAVLYNSVRSHPQMLAVALAIWAYVFFDKRRFVPAIIVSPILAALSIYTKQTMIALPIASIIWLFLRKREWLSYYLLTLSVAGLAPLAWLQRSTGGDFWKSAYTLNHLSFNVLDIPLVLTHHAGPLVFFIGLAAVVLVGRLRSNSWEPIDIYLLAAAAITFVSCGRIGAFAQYVVEFCALVVLYVLCATGVQVLKGRSILISVQVICLLIYAPLYVFLEHGPYAIASRRASAQILPLVRSDPGPMISQNGGLALFGTGQIYIEMFEYAAFSRMGLWDGKKLIREIENRRLRWVITMFDLFEDKLNPDDRERFTPEVVRALRGNYELQKRIGPYYIYRPRELSGYTSVQSCSAGFFSWPLSQISSVRASYLSVYVGEITCLVT